MRLTAVLAALLLASGTLAAGWVEGDTIRPVALEDQHGRRGEIDERVRVLLFTRDMGGGGVVKEALADADQAFLDARGVVYVADIGGMPAMISRLFALPAMRKRPYRVLVDRDGSATREFPRAEGKATVILLDRLRVMRVSYAASAAELKAALAGGAGTGG